MDTSPSQDSHTQTHSHLEAISINQFESTHSSCFWTVGGNYCYYWIMWRKPTQMLVEEVKIDTYYSPREIHNSWYKSSELGIGPRTFFFLLLLQWNCQQLSRLFRHVCLEGDHQWMWVEKATAAKAAQSENKLKYLTPGNNYKRLTPSWSALPSEQRS